jgi:hypothetical protein
MVPRPDAAASAVDVLHGAVVRAGERMAAARAVLAEHQPDTFLLMALLRRPAPMAFLEALVLTPPWSRDARVLAAVVLNPKAPPRLSVPLLPSLFWHDQAEVARTMRIVPPVRTRAEALVLERLPDLRLGERIALGRIATPLVLRTLLRDSEVRVVEAALLNSRLREEDLLMVVRAADVRPIVLEAAARTRRWAERYNVRLELALQPRTPLPLALAQLTSLVRRDLIRISEAQGLHPLVQAAALRAAAGPPVHAAGSPKSRGIRKID